MTKGLFNRILSYIERSDFVSDKIALAMTKYIDTIDSLYGLEVTEIGKISKFLSFYEHMRKVRLV